MQAAIAEMLQAALPLTTRDSRSRFIELSGMRAFNEWKEGETVQVFLSRLNEGLFNLGVTDGPHFWGASSNPGLPWPWLDSALEDKRRWWGVFPVTGSSEGIYLHLHAICRSDDETRMTACWYDAPMVALAKVWRWEEAWPVVMATHALLDA